MKPCLAKAATPCKIFALSDVRALDAGHAAAVGDAVRVSDCCVCMLRAELRAVTDAEIDYLFNVFLLIDRDGSGEIDVGEFFSFFEIEHSPFGDKLFEYMGTCQHHGARACLAIVMDV